jgi:hypothetical protein
MILTPKKRSDFFFLIGFFLINFVGIMLLLATFTFIAKQSLNRLHFPCAFLLSAIINWGACRYYFKDNISVFWKSTILVIVLILISLTIASYFYDISYDGQWYHQETLIQLKGGWNPIYQHLSEKIDVSLWLNHYAKGAEIPEAVVYVFFNRIETGKAVNIILLFASFCLVVSFLFRVGKLSTFKVYLIAALLTCNPVFMAQVLTYYVDLQLGLLLLNLLIILGLIIFEKDNYKLFLFSIVNCIALNIKFTALPYVGIVIIGVLVVLYLKKQMVQFKYVFICAAISTIVAIFIVGYNPYVKNTIEHGNPFYPLAGKDKVDIMLGNSPPGFLQNNRLYNLGVSILSNTSGGLNVENKHSYIKMPFTFNMSELVESSDTDARLGGFGFLFSGIMILTMFLFGAVLFKSSKENRFLLLSILTVLTVSIFIMEYAWWARYTPQLWFIPIIILGFSELIKSTTVKWLSATIYLFISINVCVVSVFILVRNIVATQDIDYKLKEIKSVKDNVKYVDFGNLKPERIKFLENNIKYVSHSVQKGIIIDIKNIFTKVELKQKPVKFNEPFIHKLYRRFYHNRSD